MAYPPGACPGCIYSGHPHLETCEHSMAWILRKHKQQREWNELTQAACLLRSDEVPIVTEYIKRFISSRPK